MRELLRFYSDHWISKAPDSEFEFYKERLPALGIYPPKWFREGNWEGHEDDLRKLARKGRETVLPSVFYLLFSDRDFLTTFQLRVAQYVRTLKKLDHPDLLASDGIIFRPSYIPQWLKNGVFHRDRGRCQSCKKDMTGILRSINDIELDHIVPLANGGSNEPTNFQLLCGKCNSSNWRHDKRYEATFSPYWE
jgi:hypothetical protein